MMYDGREYRPNRHLGWREAQECAGIVPDTYADGGFTTEVGQKMRWPNVVIFRVKNAHRYEDEHGRERINTWRTKPHMCIPICAHTTNNVALGVPTIKSRSGVLLNTGRHAGQRTLPGQPFVEQAHYLVYDGRVYQWTSRRLAKEEDMAA